MKLDELKPIRDLLIEQFIQEIFMQKDKEYPKLSKEILDSHSDETLNTKIKKIIPLENNEYQLIVIKEKASLYKDKKLLGFMYVKGREINNKKYLNIDLIYIIPEARDSKALLIMLNGFRSTFKLPLLIDGAIFNGGVRTIKFLTLQNDFRISILDLNSYEEISYKGEIINDKDKALVIEGFSWPAFMSYKIGEYHQEISSILFESF